MSPITPTLFRLISHLFQILGTILLVFSAAVLMRALIPQIGEWSDPLYCKRVDCRGAPALSAALGPGAAGLGLLWLGSFGIVVLGAVHRPPPKDERHPLSGHPL